MHCRFCGNKGHNRNSCPSVKNHAAIAAQKIAEGKDFYELDWNERYAHSVMKRKAERKVSAEPRKCSYCNNSGHNRASCTTLADDKYRVTGYETRFRAAVAKWVQNSGLGVGAIISTDTKYTYSDFSAFVLNIDLNNLNIVNYNGSGGFLTAQYLNRANYEGDQFMAPIPSNANYPFSGRSAFLISSPSCVPFDTSEYCSNTEIQKFVSKLFDQKSTRNNRWRDNTIGRYNSDRPEFGTIDNIVSEIESKV